MKIIIKYEINKSIKFKSQNKSWYLFLWLIHILKCKTKFKSNFWNSIFSIIFLTSNPKNELLNNDNFSIDLFKLLKAPSSLLSNIHCKPAASWINPLKKISSSQSRVFHTSSQDSCACQNWFLLNNEILFENLKSVKYLNLVQLKKLYCWYFFLEAVKFLIIYIKIK